MKAWSFGVIGLGSVSEFHLAAIRELASARLAAVSGRKPARAAEIAAREGCEWTTDYRELLARSDVEVICLTTSSGSHAAIGMDVLRAGKHLIVEKPIAMTAEEAASMNALAAERGLMIGVISQRRFEPQHAHAYAAVRSGKLGRLLMIESGCPFYRTQQYFEEAPWRGTLDQDGGAVMNQGIHMVDMMLWMGGGARSVYAKAATRTHDIEAPDIAAAVLEFESGAYGLFTASTSLQPGFPPYLRIYGERGAVKIEGTSITHWSVPDMPEPEFAADGTTGGGASVPLAISMDYHRMQIADFIDALTEGRPPLVTGEDGERAVRVVEAIHRSASEGKEIRL